MEYSPKRFAARMNSLRDVISHIDDICRKNKLGTQQTLHVELVIEELFTNSVSHGYGGDSEQPVWISASGDADSLYIAYQDEARACNPLECLPHPARTGGEGIKLVKQFCDARYQREAGRNTLQLRFSPRTN
jgi:anti-sigma regulatory factor (Ser/Thr protein kinase)